MRRHHGERAGRSEQHGGDRRARLVRHGGQPAPSGDPERQPEGRGGEAPGPPVLDRQPGEQRGAVGGAVGADADLVRTVDLEAAPAGVGDPAGDRRRAAVEGGGEAPVGRAHGLGRDRGLVRAAGARLVAVDLLEGEDVRVERGDGLGQRGGGVGSSPVGGVGERSAVRAEGLSVQQVEGRDAQLAHAPNIVRREDLPVTDRA